jgi:hypothetical protein
MPMRVNPPYKRIIETTLTVAEVVAGADGTDQTFSITGYGLTAEDFVKVHFTDLDADLMFCNEHISANNTLKIRFSNQSAGNITAGATVTKILVF